MKNHFLIMCLAAALLAGCSKEPETLDGNAPATYISAKATGAESPETKAPLTGTSLNGQQGQVYTTVLPLDAYMSDKATMFTDAYASGMMTFADNSYVMYDTSGFSGKMQLPNDKSPLYLYGFYPTGWTLARATGASGAYESLSHTFDGKTDLMATWLTASDQQKIAYLGGKSGTLSDRADFMFRHLLTRYNVQIKAGDASAQKFWGRVKSIRLKDAATDKVSTGENFGYTYSASGGAVSFYKLTGTPTVPTYSDDVFEKTAFADMLPLTMTYQNACYVMAAPVDVDASTATPELTLVVVTQDKDGGTEQTANVPLSLDRTQLSAAIFANNTSGYSITVALNFHGGVIEASTLVEAWKDGSDQTESVKPAVPPAIGEFKDGGIVYWADATDAMKYKVFSLAQSQGAWSAGGYYVLGAGDGQNETNGKRNVSAMKAYSAAVVANNTSGVFAIDFPAAGFCEGLNTGGVTGWYLPAKEELETLFRVYFAHKDVVDGAIAANGGAAIPEGGFFYSGTEDSGNNNNAWSVTCMDGRLVSEAKGRSYYNIRCVKNIAPPPPAIGEFKDGGVVYWVDAMDDTNYKVVSVDERGMGIATSVTDAIGLKNENDGRVNIRKTKDYAVTHGKNFSEFSAFNYCDAKGPGWYVPAKNELKTLYDACQSNTAIINNALTSNGGTVITADALLTSTEGIAQTSNLFVLNFGDGQLAERSKTGPSYTRCIKSTVAPLPPPPATIGDLKDGGIVYEVTDADNYKVFSLPAVRKAWSKDDTMRTLLIANTQGKDTSDGRKNVADMKLCSADTGNGGSNDFAVDFPAAAYCEGLGTGWYLPSNDELQAIYALYTVDKTAFNTNITNKGGDAIPESLHWSSTIHPSANYVVDIHFGFGSPGSPVTYEQYIRCVKRSK